MRKPKRLLCHALIAFLCLSNILTVHATAETTEVSTEETTNETNSDPSLWPDGPSVEAESAILMDINTGTILYEKNVNEELYPASITKIMTTLLALENCSLDEIVTFSHNAVYSIEPGSSHIGIVDGEQLTMEQCLYGIMLESANEVSNAVAEHVGGSIEGFVDMMNAKAAELGCLNTHFDNANGLPDEEHYTSAYDMALIGRAAMQNETFRTITSTTSYTIPPTNLQVEARPLSNHHKMLPKRSYADADVIGGKTGYTNVARQTLVTFAKRGDMELVCVVMKTEAPLQYTETKELFDWGFENFQILNISENEKDYTLQNASFYDSETSIFGNTDSMIEINKSGEIILPITAAFSDADSTLEYNNDGSNSFASLSYSYGGKTVGSTTIDLTNLNIPEFNFSSSNSVDASDSSTASTPDSSKKAIVFTKTQIIVVVVIVIVLILLTILSVILFRNYHFFKRRQIRKHRRERLKLDDFDFKS
ncbi:D-alanyl-D-alanine carboxypeptidase family protein [Konateibacter massiliensis]|uniref:D-alanyl-D-alanine carboxypeptidase family protein n=1 Tax=Konateibacter massiliensis TaxID=2002841 RepID=UPI000C147520|nr:D-alanyl-D-alanine carboxypeptidase family protein [Konateibacter massiliensis]